MTYLPAPDHRSELARLDAMMLGLTSAVVSLYGAVAEIASASSDVALQQALHQKMEESSKQLDEVIAVMKAKM